MGCGVSKTDQQAGANKDPAPTTAIPVSQRPLSPETVPERAPSAAADPIRAASPAQPVEQPAVSQPTVRSHTPPVVSANPPSSVQESVRSATPVIPGDRAPSVASLHQDYRAPTPDNVRAPSVASYHEPVRAASVHETARAPSVASLGRPASPGMPQDFVGQSAQFEQTYQTADPRSATPPVAAAQQYDTYGRAATPPVSGYDRAPSVASYHDPVRAGSPAVDQVRAGSPVVSQTYDRAASVASYHDPVRAASVASGIRPASPAAFQEIRPQSPAQQQSYSSQPYISQSTAPSVSSLQQDQGIPSQQALLASQLQTAAYEKALMEEEDQRSASREQQEQEQQRVMAMEYAIKKKDAEESRLKKLEADAIKKDQQDAQNPNLLSFKVIFPNEQVHEVYRYHLPKDTATVLDLKLAVNMDFGYSFTQQRFFYKFKEVEDEQIIGKLPEWNASSVLHFFPTGNPPVVPERIMRPLQRESTVAELRMQSVTDAQQVRDWAAELHSIEVGSRDTPLERLQAEKALYELQEDFVEASEHAVQAILSGQVQPSFAHDLFGSGGDKYFVNGVVLRKCAGWEVLGENVGEGDAAFKAGGNELKALDFLRGKVSGLTVPLACVVDHYGNRFLCLAAVDIGFNTLLYGSNNDGLVIKDVEQAAPLAQGVAQVANLKAHKVVERLSQSEVMLFTAYTTELHHTGGQDGFFTLINAGRLLPPDNPSSDRIDHVVKLLRPELVSKYGAGEQVQRGYVLYTWKAPRACDSCSQIILDYEYYTYDKRGYDVCPKCYNSKGPDAFKYPKNRLAPASVPESQRLTYWKNAAEDVQLVKPIQLTPLNPDAYASKGDAQGIAELKAASAYLQDTVIARFVAELDNLQCTPLNGKQLSEEMHKRGINIRYLGKLAADVKYNHVRELCVREILARTIKVLTRDGISFLPHYNENDAKTVVLHYLNEIFSPVESESSMTVWKYIEELAHKKFAYNVEETVRDKLYCLALAHSIAEKLGISLSKYKGFDFGQQRTFELEDISVVAPKSKHVPFACHEADGLLTRAGDLDNKGKRKNWYQTGGPERVEATELFKEAFAVCEFVYGTAHPKTADAYFALAAQLESRHQEQGRPERSRWNRSAGVPADNTSAEAELYYTKALKTRKEYLGFYHEDVARCYLGLARLYKGGDTAQLVAIMNKAVDIVESLLGFNHPETAELYRIMALIYQEANQTKVAAPWIRKAFVINMSIFGKDSEITRDTWRALQGIELKIDSGLENVPIEELTARIEEMHFDR
eukprot:TRINITY_DN6297_c0_g1_i1.p1 TRINITY_DN6297_c0_g1~~TRINITY_DN6297_c0_g1_i1.p1  ORF type:complete len:1269 (+),score=363.22 TRINITY_DN6297_c0_g1_i1:61-3867(+)